MLSSFPKKTTESLKCPAMRVEVICSFARNKRNPKGTPLLDGNHDGCDPVRNVMTGEQMLSKGGWRAPKTMEMDGSAISNVHRVHSHNGAHLDSILERRCLVLICPKGAHGRTSSSGRNG
jgi:hypothetical protein